MPSRTQMLMRWIIANLNEDGQINRRMIKVYARKTYGLHSTNHLYGTSQPLMRKVSGTDFATLAG